MTDLVVDACVLRSAGYGTDGMSRSSRELLAAVMESDCVVLTSDDLTNEWMRHAGKIALAWLAAMESRGKILHVAIASGREEGLLLAIDRLNDSHRRSALKDVHLIMLAVRYFALIVSHEKASRNVFSILSRIVDSLNDVYWTSPDLLLSYGFVHGGQGQCPATWALSHVDCS